MRVVVCVKEVADPDRVNELAQGRYLRVDAEALDLDREHIAAVMNGNDEQAITVATSLRAAAEDCEVIALGCTSGNPEPLLRRAMELGADRACWVHLDAPLHSPRSVAHVLARAVRFIGGADVVLCGHQASDDDQGVVGPLLAAQLDAGFADEVHRVEAASASTVLLHRRTAEEDVVLEAQRPVVAAIKDDAWQPPIPKAVHIIAARRVPPVELSAGEIGVDAPRIAGYEAAMERVAFELVESSGTCDIIDGPSLDAVAAALVARLRAGGVL
jgi:electron transfer flavoprotein beta subunit